MTLGRGAPGPRKGGSRLTQRGSLRAHVSAPRPPQIPQRDTSHPALWSTGDDGSATVTAPLGSLLGHLLLSGEASEDTRGLGVRCPGVSASWPHMGLGAAEGQERPVGETSCQVPPTLLALGRTAGKAATKTPTTEGEPVLTVRATESLTRPGTGGQCGSQDSGLRGRPGRGWTEPQHDYEGYTEAPHSWLLKEKLCSRAPPPC